MAPTRELTRHSHILNPFGPRPAKYHVRLDVGGRQFAAVAFFYTIKKPDFDRILRYKEPSAAPPAEPSFFDTGPSTFRHGKQVDLEQEAEDKNNFGRNSGSGPSSSRAGQNSPGSNFPGGSKMRPDRARTQTMIGGRGSEQAPEAEVRDGPRCGIVDRGKAAQRPTPHDESKSAFGRSAKAMLSSK